MKVYKYEFDSIEEVWTGSEPFSKNSKAETVELAFTDTRHPAAFEGEIYVQESNSNQVRNGAEPDEVWSLDAEEVVSSPFRDLADEVEENEDT